MNALAKTLFLLQQYLWLSIFIASTFGLGRLALGAFLAGTYLPPMLLGLLSVTTGMGLIIFALLILGNIGQLTALSIYSLLYLGLLATTFTAWRAFQKGWSSCAPGSGIAKNLKQNWFWWALLVIVVSPLLIRPLQIPRQWDELMYHLPLAKAWAEEGYLVVQPWLRYPLFPYNYNLLYAASLLVADDIFTHLLHMLAGILTAAVLVAAGQRWFDWRVGIIAAILLLATVKGEFGGAFIDMGVMLFISFGFISLALAYDTHDNRLFYLSGFFVALALGTKYQSLFYVPVYGFFVLMVERRPRVLAIFSLVILITGSYWYVRNWVISGDPIHPVGGPWFGFWLWDEGDLHAQFADFDHRKRLPNPGLLIGFLAIIFIRNSSSILKGLYVAALASFLVWFFASGYRRYLMPAVPFLALLSAVTIIRVYDAIRASTWSSMWKVRLSKGVLTSLSIIILVAGVVAALDSASPYWNRIATNSAMREALLEKTLSSYAILREFGGDEELWPIYQLGFEDELYYSPVPLIGEVFGPGRYRDVIRLADNGAALAEHLRGLGAGGLLVNRAREPFNKIHFDLDNQYFSRVSSTARADLYRLVEN